MSRPPFCLIFAGVERTVRHWVPVSNCRHRENTTDLQLSPLLSARPTSPKPNKRRKAAYV